MIAFRRFLKDRLRSTLWWAGGLSGGLLLSVAFYPSIKDQPFLDDLLKDAPEGLKALAGAQGGLSLTSPAGFLNSQVFAQVLPVAMLVLAIGVGARAIAGSEADGTLELMLANPITRRRVAVERYLSAVSVVVVIGVVSTIVLVAAAPVFQLSDGLSMVDLMAACLACTCFAILHCTLAFAVGAASGSRGNAIAVAAAVGVGGFILFGLVSGGIVEPLRFVSPWWWYLSRNILAFGLPPEAVLAPLALSVVLAAVGIVSFEARDLRSS